MTEEFRKIYNECKEEELENQKRLTHNMVAKDIESRQSYQNEKFLKLVSYTDELINGPKLEVKKQEFSPPHKHFLNNMTAYLSGAIEYATDDGVNWRVECRKLANDYGIPINFLDPTKKNSDSIQPEIGLERKKLRELKSSGEFEEVRKIMKSVRRWDLRAVDHSDFIIVVIDPTVPTWGTPDEIVTAERQKKPIITVVKGGICKCPDWVFAIVKPDEMFDSIENAMIYLKKLDSGEVPLDDRWVVI